MRKTDISSTFRKFLAKCEPKIHFKEGGCADRIMMHIARFDYFKIRFENIWTIDLITKVLVILHNVGAEADDQSESIEIL